MMSVACPLSTNAIIEGYQVGQAQFALGEG